MPIFEYACLNCGRKFSHLSGVVADETAPACPRCGGTELKKLFSRFATVRSAEEDREDYDGGDDLEDEAPEGDDYGEEDEEGY